MPWTKLDDGFYLNPKIISLSDAAFRVYINALNYSTAQLTDGHIASAVLPVVTVGMSPAKARKATRELCEQGRWVETDDGWIIHDYSEFQPLAADVARTRAERKARALKGNHERWHNDGRTDSSCEWCNDPSSIVQGSSDDNGTNRPTRPDPTRPVTTKGVGVENGKGGVWGGLPKQEHIPADEWAVACAMVNERYLEGYDIDNPEAFGVWLWKTERDVIRSRLAEPLPSELTTNIGRQIPEDT